MGVIPDDNRDGKLQINHLKPHHRAMVRYAAAGKRPGEIATIFGMSPAHVSVITNSPLFQAEVNRLIANLELSIPDAAADLQALLGRAVEVLGEELYIGPQGSKLRSKVAFEVLDRTGFGKQSDIHIGDKTVNIFTNTPRPGDDPQETESAMKLLRDESITVDGEDNGDN